MPVVALVVALAGLVLAFQRWGERGTVHATDADRALVDAALDDDGRGQRRGEGTDRARRARPSRPDAKGRGGTSVPSP